MLAALAQLLPVKVIIPVHAAIQVGSNTGRALIMRKHVRWDFFSWFCVGSILGAIAGGNVVISLPVELLRGILGAFILFTVWGPKLSGLISNNLGLALGGLISTFLTMFVGATGPFVIAMFRALELGRLSLIATSAAALIVQHGFKVVVFALLGFVFAPYIWLIGLMIASGFIGTLIGRNILFKVNEKKFQWWLNVVLSLLAIRLIWAAMS